MSFQRLKKISLHKLSLIKGFFSFVVLLLIVGSESILFSTINEMSKMERHRHLAYILADELRKGSDDLTRLVRNYVATSDASYLQDYYRVLRIRDGEEERPPRYDEFSYELATRKSQNSSHEGWKKKPYREMVKQSELHPEEKELLLESLDASDTLAELEVYAVAILQAAEQWDSTAEESRAARAEALGILYSQEYLDRKRLIYEPLHKFFAEHQARINRELQILVGESQQVQIFNKATTYVVAVILVANLMLILLLVLRPIREISVTLEQITQGNIDKEIPYLDWGNEIGSMARNAETFRKNTALMQRAADMEFFIRVAAHDLRAPIKNALLLTDFLSVSKDGVQALSTESIAKKLKVTLTGVMMLLAELRKLTVINNDGLSVDSISVSEILVDGYDELNLSEAGKKIKMELQGDIELSCYKNLVKQLFINLIENAAVYGSDPVELSIECTSVNGNPSVVFSNNTSFNYTEEDQLLVPLKRGTSDRKSGLGLGLAICKRIMELHNGQVELGLSQPGTFSVQLTFGNNRKYEGE